MQQIIDRRQRGLAVHLYLECLLHPVWDDVKVLPNTIYSMRFTMSYYGVTSICATARRVGKPSAWWTTSLLNRSRRGKLYPQNLLQLPEVEVHRLLDDKDPDCRTWTAVQIIGSTEYLSVAERCLPEVQDHEILRLALAKGHRVTHNLHNNDDFREIKDELWRQNACLQQMRSQPHIVNNRAMRTKYLMNAAKKLLWQQSLVGNFSQLDLDLQRCLCRRVFG